MPFHTPPTPLASKRSIDALRGEKLFEHIEGALVPSMRESARYRCRLCGYEKTTTNTATFTRHAIRHVERLEAVDLQDSMTVWGTDRFFIGPDAPAVVFDGRGKPVLGCDVIIEWNAGRQEYVAFSPEYAGLEGAGPEHMIALQRLLPHLAIAATKG
jgi:hypothetical protein